MTMKWAGFFKPGLKGAFVVSLSAALALVLLNPELMFPGGRWIQPLVFYALGAYVVAVTALDVCSGLRPDMADGSKVLIALVSGLFIAGSIMFCIYWIIVPAIIEPVATGAASDARASATAAFGMAGALLAGHAGWALASRGGHGKRPLVMSSATVAGLIAGGLAGGAIGYAVYS